MYKQLTILAFACSLAVGCRDNSTTTTTPGADMATGSAGGGGTGGGGGTTGGTGDMAGTTYTPETILAMRTAGTYGTYELDNVILLAVNPAGTHMYVQDAAGGDLSAIEVQCSGTSHPCTLASTLSGFAPGSKLTLQGLYEKGSAANAGYETFYVSSATNNGAGTAPPVATVTLADIANSAATASRKYWNEKVSLTLTDGLVLYDISPAVFKYTPTAPKTCPNNFGFGMIAATGAPAPVAACGATCDTATDMGVASTCTQPAPNATANAAEVLIGTDFYKGFTYSADCTCYAGFSDVGVKLDATVASGSTIKGILIHSSTTANASTGGYIYLAPTSNAASGGDFVFATN